MRTGTLRLTLLSMLLAGSASANDFQQSLAVRPGGTLEVDLDGGSVEVESHDRDEIRVDASTSAGWGRMRFELTGDGTDARLRGQAHGWLGWVLDTRVRVHVRVPEQYSLRVRTAGGSVEIEELKGTVTATTSGGRIELKEVDGPVDLRTSGGSIEAEEIGGDLSAKTSGGRIRVAEAQGRVEVRTSGGGLDLLDVRGPVEARTSGGPITARFSDVPEGRLETSGGSIEVEFPEGAGVDLDAQTSGGRIEVDHEIRIRGRIDPDRIKGEMNGGGPELRLRTSGGSIRLQAR